MKHLFKISIVAVVLLSIFIACEEHEHGPLFSDEGGAPSIIENVVVTPTHGGLDISYNLPNDSNLLYVKAVYTNSKGEKSEVITSAYDNKIEILGYGDTNEKTVMLYSVSSSQIESAAVSVTGSPLTPPVILVQETMSIDADFGGARYSWTNVLNAPIIVELMTTNSEGVLETVETVYTEQAEIRKTLRGYDSAPRAFAAVIRDKYDNYSDIIYADTPDGLLTPLLEERLDKTLFNKVILANDDNWDAWEGDYWHAFDDALETIVHTQGDHPRPSILTVDLGQVVTLSRFTVHQRLSHGDLHAYGHGQPKIYTVYGSKELPGQDGDLDDWILLRECESIKPSGLPNGTETDEDIDHLWAGDEYSFEEYPEIRYFRIAVYDTWDGAGFINFSQMTFWGNIVE